MSFSGQTLFIADLHLKPANTNTVALALDFFEQAQTAKALYIIGDLFEYWLGDDAIDPALNLVHDALAQLSEHNTELHLMHGNRDFLLGHDYADKVNATLHTDDHLSLTLGGTSWTVLHGDTLCSDDLGYQQLRKLVRNPQWQRAFLDKPIEERINDANELRKKSQAAVANKQTSIMDVNPQRVVECLNALRVDNMLHGHTHRPADHRFTHATDKQRQLRRLVLGDWHEDHAMIARFDGQQMLLEHFSAR